MGETVLPMDPAVDNQPQESPVAQSDGVIVSKRQMENVDKEELPAKRLKNGGGDDLRRVAEIVLVLSALAGMRGGKKSPTEAEVELMEEARGRLVEICKDLAPKDLVGRDSIGNIIEDLGLNSKLKDQRLGFRGSRLSIKEKFLLSKRKMEDSKKFAVPSASYTSQMMQPSLGATPETRGPSQIIRILPPDKSSKAPLPSGGFSASFPASHVSAATPASATHQPLATDTRASTVSAGLPNNLKGRDLASVLYPKVEKPQFKLEAGSNGAAYAPQVQANASANHPSVNASTWSVQPHSASLGKSVPENKAPNHNSAKVEGPADSGLTRATPQAARDQTFRPSIPQAASANLPSAPPPMQGMKYGQPYNNHNEIAKMVQRLLNPKLPEHPTWTPPSREYMNKALSCQICKFLVNEVETVVICDACETGFHLKCLEGANQKGIPRGEWHCMKCMTLSNGKPLPPKYGRVMRSITQPKGHMNPAGTQASSEKKPGTVDSKLNQERIAANQSLGSQNTGGSGTVSGSDVQSTSDSRIRSEREILRNGMTLCGKDADRGTCSGTFPNNSTERSTQLAQVSELSRQDERTLSEPELQSSALSTDKISNNSEDSKISNCEDSMQVVAKAELSNSAKAPSMTHQDHSIMKRSLSRTRNSDCSSRFEAKKSQEDAANTNPVGHSEPNNAAGEHPCLSSDGFHGVEWIGDVTKAADGKTFYESCCVNGVTYKVHDHALFNSSHGKLMPFKLQAMWEGAESGSKWVLVSQCYIPGDLPEAVGHPCAPESNEVYESNHEISLMAGLIEGPCEVLPPTKFKEKCERQNELAAEANSESPPVFICKWFFDELKGNFQPVFN